MAGVTRSCKPYNFLPYTIGNEHTMCNLYAFFVEFTPDVKMFCIFEFGKHCKKNSNKEIQWLSRETKGGEKTRTTLEYFLNSTKAC